MATVSVLNPVSEDAEFRKKEARDHWKAIQQSGPLVSTNSLRIGYHAAALKRDNLFGILGYANEKEAQEASGVKQATWYNVMRIAEAFPGVDEKLFIAQKLTNAEALMDLPESKRLTEYWLRRAATDSIDTFQSLVDTELDGHAKASAGREKVVSISIKMTKSQKKSIDAGIQEISKELGCEGNEAKTLELMVAERKEGVSLVGTISKAIDRIAAIKELSNSGLSSDEVLEKAYTGLDEIVADFRAALENLQNGVTE
jgi:isopentenyldiphosphate isomerase